MAAATPVSNYAAQGSPNDVPSQDEQAPARNGGNSEPRKSALHRLARAWFAIRWRLAETIFARPLPWVTANLELKLGDLIVTLPVAVGFLAWNAWLSYQVQVKESGNPASLMMLLVFALTVRNNSILLSLTGLPYERALLYHKFFGVVAILVVGLHGLAYLRESAGVSIARRQRRRLLAMGNRNNAPGTTVTYQAPTFTPELSGAIIFYLLIALFVLSLNPIRRRFYELFLRTHVLLFVGIVVFSAIHGAGLVVVGTGIWAVDMVFRHGYVAPKYQKGSSASCGATAKRMGVLAKEQILMTKLSGDIVRIQFPKVRADTGACFYYEAGQYVFVCVPKLGYLEWHPFTISSSPHEALVTIHVKVLGDWTKRLMQQVSSASNDSNLPVPAPFSVLFDGPYGQVSLDIASPKTYAHFALFSGGIGITPMQAIANQLYYEYHHQGRHAIKRVRFVWSVRDRATILALFSRDFVEFKKHQIGSSSLPYRAPYLPDLLLSSTTNEPRNVFFTEFFLTKGGASEPENPVDQQLQHCLRYNSRPRIRETLQSVGEDAKATNKSRVAVLVCGPAAMVKEVVAEALSLSREMEISFDVHTESFDF